MSEGRIDVEVSTFCKDRICVFFEAVLPALQASVPNGAVAADLTVAEAQYLSDELAGAIEAEARQSTNGTAA